MGISIAMDNARIGFPTAYDAHHELFNKPENKTALNAIMDQRWSLSVEDTYTFPFTFERTWRLSAHFMPGDEIWQDLTGTKQIVTFIHAAMQGSFAHSRSGTHIVVQGIAETYCLQVYGHPKIQVHAHHNGVQMVISQTSSRRVQTVVNRPLAASTRYFEEMEKALGKDTAIVQEEVPKWILIPSPIVEQNGPLLYDAALELHNSLLRKWELVDLDAKTDQWGRGSIKIRISEGEYVYNTQRSVRSLIDETARSLSESLSQRHVPDYAQHRHYHVFSLYNPDDGSHITVTPHALEIEREKGYVVIQVKEGYVSKGVDHFQFVEKYKRIRERIDHAFKVEDKRRIWEQLRYKYQGHEIFIAKFPSGMPAQLKEDLKVVFEQNVRHLQGLRVEARTTAPNSSVAEKMGDQRLILTIPELKDMFVNNTLKAWVRGYVYGLNYNHLLTYGLELLIIEPTESGRGVATSWKLSQFFPEDTGDYMVDSENQSPKKELVYKIDFKFNYDVGQDIDAVAAEYLNKRLQDGQEKDTDRP